MDIQYDGQDFYVPMGRFLYLVITVLQYNSQNAEVPMGSKQPGLIVFTMMHKMSYLSNDMVIEIL